MAAGFNSFKSELDTAKACMLFTEPPRTPPEVRMFRRSAKLEPGTRYQNHKQVVDSIDLRLQERKFGITSDSTNEGAAGLITAERPTILQKIKDERAEQLYKGASREPLGRSYNRGTVLPEKFKGGVPFGVSSDKGALTSKELIWPNIKTKPEDEEIYMKSHGSYGPGVQTSRHYQWNYDPARTVFGQKGKSIALNGVSKNIEDVLKGTIEDRGSLVNTKTVILLLLFYLFRTFF